MGDTRAHHLEWKEHQWRGLFSVDGAYPSVNVACLQGRRRIPIDLARGVKWDDAAFYDFVHNTPAGSEENRNLFV